MSKRDEINARELASEHLKRDLGERAAKAGIIAVAAQPIRMALQFASTAIMARLLAPQDFGLVAMASTVTSFVAIFSTLSLGAATVQREKLDQDMVSGLFFITLAVGFALMPLAWLVAPVAAWFYKDPRVTWLIIAMSVGLPLNAAGAQHTALQVRGMRWMTIQWIGLASFVLGALAGILTAWLTPLGYWSLVISLWITTGSSLVLTWITCRWRPTRVKDWAPARDALNFGLHLTGFSVVNFFHRQLDNVIIGWRSGAAELGYYTRAYQLMLLPITLFNGPLTSAVEPSLSRLQNEPERWRRALLDALALLTFLGSGLSAVLIAAAEPIVTLLYGDNWRKTAVIFQWLAVSNFAGAAMNATGWIYISLGRGRRMLHWSLLFTPVVGAGFLIAMPWGGVGIAIAYAIVMNLSLVPGFAFATRDTPVSLWDTMKVMLPMMASGVVAGLAGLWPPLHAAPLLVRLVLSGGVSGLVYVLLAGFLIARTAGYRDLRERGVSLGGTLITRARSWLKASRSASRSTT